MPQDTRPLQSGAASILYGLSSLYSLELSRRHKSRCVAVSRLCSSAQVLGRKAQHSRQYTQKSEEGVRGGFAKVSQRWVRPLFRSASNQRPNCPPPDPITRFSLDPCAIISCLSAHTKHTHNIYLYEVISARTIREYCLLRSVERIPFYLVRTLMNNWLAVVHLNTLKSPVSESMENSQLSPVPETSDTLWAVEIF